MTAIKLPAPTICSMNCFKPPGHEGPHQKWLGSPCDGCPTGKAQFEEQFANSTSIAETGFSSSPEVSGP